MAHTRPTEQDEIRRMSTPREWPNLVLPVKNRKEKQDGGFPLLGVMFDSPDEKTRLTVFLIGMYQLHEHKGDLKDIPRREYTSYDEIVQAGWVVD
jgi:hypothetical protein